MRRRDEADVMTAPLLQLQHHLGQAFVRDLILLLLTPDLRDLVILTIDAAEIAVAEKDVAGAVRSAQTWLLAKVGRVA